MQNSDTHPTSVEISDLSFQYSNGLKKITALKNVTFSVKRGEFLSIIGPSGAGKSTLLRIIAGLAKPSSGTIQHSFKRVGMVFQGHALFPWLTATDNAAFGLKMRNIPPKERTRTAHEKLNEVELRGFENRYPHELSGGQHQRVSVARALAIEPDLLILDEPFSSLDSITANDLKLDIAALWERYHMTIIMVNHIVADAVQFSDRVIVFDKIGTIQRIVPIDLPRPRNPRSPESFKLEDHLTSLIS